jgi:hypothetical protein
MLDIFAQYATDETLENDGVWIGNFLVARSGNRQYVKVLTAAVDKNKVALDVKGDEAEKLSDKIMIDTLAESVLLGWKDVGYKGAPLEYTKANARMLLAHKDFRREVAKMAEDISSFKATLEGEQEKN